MLDDDEDIAKELASLEQCLLPALAIIAVASSELIERGMWTPLLAELAAASRAAFLRRWQAIACDADLLREEAATWSPQHLDHMARLLGELADRYPPQDGVHQLQRILEVERASRGFD